jgi:hypothetical protein
MQIQWCVEKEERIINGHDTPPTGKASAPGTSGVCGAIIERNKKPQPPNKFYFYFLSFFFFFHYFYSLTKT